MKSVDSIDDWEWSRGALWKMSFKFVREQYYFRKRTYQLSNPKVVFSSFFRQFVFQRLTFSTQEQFQHFAFGILKFTIKYFFQPILLKGNKGHDIFVQKSQTIMKHMGFNQNCFGSDWQRFRSDRTHSDAISIKPNPGQ